MILKIGTRRPRSGRPPFLVSGLGEADRDCRREPRVEKWEIRFVVFHFSTRGSPGRGNVEISRFGRDFQGAVGRAENLPSVFRAFHRPAISTAPGCRLYKNRGGIGDSLFARASSLAFAAITFRAHSVSLIAPASVSNCAKPIPALRWCAASGSPFSFS